MGTQTTGGGSTTSFTNTPQANSDTYNYIEDVLYGDSTLYNQTSKTIYLDVLSNDLGGSAKTLFSIDDGTGALTDLLQSNVTTGWEQTADGNWIRINAGKIEFKIGDGSTNIANARDVNSLNAGEYVDDTFLYAIRLANGTIAYATVHITISGENDNASISGTSTGDVTEDAVPNTVSGTLVVTDPDAGQNELQPVAAGTAGDNGHGTFEVNANGTWTYTLNNGDSAVDGLDDGESLTDTITVWSEDGTASQQITVTIHGADDQPTLDAVTAGSVSEDNQASTTTVSGLSGTLTGHDVDGDTLTYGISGGAADVSHAGYDTSLAGTYGTLYVNSSTGAYLYVPDAGAVEALDDGDTPSDSFTVTVNDGDGADVTRTYTVNLTGANDAPVSGGADSASGSEDDASITGTVPTATDVDGDSLTYHLVTGSVLVDGVAAADGTVTFNSDGSYSYDPSGDQDLAAGDTRTITFSYVANDGDANSAPATVTITVNGVNDAAVITGDTSGSATEDAVLNTASGNLNSTDVDGVDDSWNAVTTATASANGYGTYTIDASGNWVYTLDNTNTAVNNLNNGGTLSDSFTVTTADGTSQVVNITINGHTDVTDVLAPTDIVFNVNPASGSFTGNGLSNTDVIGTFTALDADSTSWTFALSGTNASSFTLAPASGLQSSVTLTPSANLAPGNYTFVVTATDGAGHSYAETYNVSVGTTGADGALSFTVSNGTDVSLGLNGGDTINGGAGDDALVGGQSNDIINGGLGNDQLIGGQGADTFIFNTALNPLTNVDTIYDFDAANTPTSDHIQLDDAIFAGIANSGGSLSSTDFAANAGGDATTATQNILYDTTTGNLYYDADGNGAGAKVLVAHITLVGGTLDASDFVVI